MSGENIGESRPGRRGVAPAPSDNPGVSSDDAPDAEELEISPAEAAEIQRQTQLGFETFEQGIQG